MLKDRNYMANLLYGDVTFRGLHTTVHNNDYCIIALQFWSVKGFPETHCENKNLSIYLLIVPLDLLLYSYLRMAGKHSNDTALCSTDVQQRIFAQSE